MKLNPILPMLVACCLVHGVRSQHVETIAGSGSGYVDGQRSLAMFNFPTAIVLDSLDNVFVADTGNGKIRKITKDGEVTTVRDTLDTPSFQAVQQPTGIAIDGRGTVYFSGIAAISSNARTDYTFLASAWNPGLRASDIVYLSSESLLIADPQAKKVLRLSLASDSNGIPEDYAGSGNDGSADGVGILSSFSFPRALASDASGNIYVSDRNLIRKVSPDLTVSTLSGNTARGFQDGDHDSARFNGPGGLAVGPTGVVYVADAGNNAIRRIDPSGTVTTLVESGFRRPTDIAIDSLGNLVICDSFNHRIRKFVFESESPANISAGVEVTLALYPGLAIKGRPGESYSIQSRDSVNSGTWRTAGSIRLPEGQKIWHDNRPVNGPRFYRAVLVE